MISVYQSKMKRIITGSKIWIHEYGPETTNQSSKKRNKVVVFFDYRDVMHKPSSSFRQAKLRFPTNIN